jgi:hypothetical protein
MADPTINANSGSVVSICTTPQPTDLDAAGYAALTWVTIAGVGSFGEAGLTTNILTYDTWESTVTQKTKGMSNAGDPTIEVARQPSNSGQDALRAAALTRFVYAIRIERSDKPDATGTNTKIYNRGIISGPVRPFGRNEDFDLEVFTLGFVQREVIVDAAAGV